MLETEKDFSRYGRVNYVLQQRLALLKEVNRLQKSLGVQGDVSYTCETAGHFYLYQVLSRWEKFLEDIAAFKKKVDEKEEEFKVSKIEDLFPFHVYFSNAPQVKLHPFVTRACTCNVLAIVQTRGLGRGDGNRPRLLVAH